MSSWWRSPIFYGLVAMVAGVLVRAMLSLSDAPPFTADRLQQIVDYQRNEQPTQSLEPRYRPYALAFLFSASAQETEAIKKTIDAELAASAVVEQQGLAGVPGHTAERLIEPDIVLIALGGALVFRSLAFVLAAGFAAGFFHQAMLHTRTITGSPSELFLAAIIAGLLWAAGFWVVRRAYARRQARS